MDKCANQPKPLHFGGNSCTNLAVKGNPAKSLRIALGALLIQKRKGLSDRKLVKEIAENPYMQYFMGLKSFQHECPFTAPALVSFRKRINAEFLMELNDQFLETASVTPEHSEENESSRASAVYSSHSSWQSKGSC